MTSTPSTSPLEPTVTPDPGNRKFLVDPYKDWSKGEGIPIHLDLGHDLLALETGEWDRYEARGCFAHTHGMGDFMANYVIEVLPGKKTRPVKHLYEAFFYVLSGYGSTTSTACSGQLAMASCAFSSSSSGTTPSLSSVA